MAKQPQPLERAARLEMSIPEMKRNHPRKWLLVGVTRRAERGEATHGYLVRVGKSEGEALSGMDEAMAECGTANDGVLIFWANPRFPGVIPGLPDTA